MLRLSDHNIVNLDFHAHARQHHWEMDTTSSKAEDLRCRGTPQSFLLVDHKKLAGIDVSLRRLLFSSSLQTSQVCMSMSTTYIK